MHFQLNYKGYRAVTSWYRHINIFSYKKIFIPVFDKNHCFLIVFDNENSVLEIYDPYGFTEYKDFKKMKLIKENKSYLDNLSRNLIDKYFKPKYEKCFEGFVLNAEVILHLPPEIPTQINDFDCGIYLIQFAKHIVHGKPFTFESKHMLTFRHEIEMELQQGRFTSFRCVVENIKGEETKNKKNGGQQGIKTVRRFENRFAEDCWMNSTLQLILTGLDHAKDCSTHGSQLWEILMFMKNDDFETPLDPSPIKQLLVSKETERVLNNAGHCSQLFLTDETYQNESNLRIGQQDARDFFICIQENQDYWRDLFKKFSVTLDTYTECLKCHHRSIQSKQYEYLFLEYECPESGTKMNQFISNKLSNPEILPEWRDEDGCKDRAGGANYNKIYSIKESEFLIIVIKRLVNYGKGPTILRNSLPLGTDAEITDTQNESAIFRPIAVIFHIGGVQENTAFGHYKADVQNIDGNWFRTSDSDMPRRISERSVTDQGYIFLYKRM